MKIERIGTTVDKLGEGTLWDERKKILYWVDGYGPTIHRLDPATGKYDRFTTKTEVVGCLGLRENGGLMAALEDGVYFLDLDKGIEELIPSTKITVTNQRYNDGKMDRQGRFVFGTVHRPMVEREDYSGWISRLDPDLSCTKIHMPIGNCNGPTFSPDGRTLYVNETASFEIYAYDYDTKSGTISNKRLFFDAKPLDSKPDGATVDADGCLWVAMLYISKIFRFTPSGKLDREIDMPILFPSNVAFGGPDLDTMYVSSISVTGRFDDRRPDAGGLFAITGLGIKGLPEPRFKG